VLGVSYDQVHGKIIVPLVKPNRHHNFLDYVLIILKLAGELILHISQTDLCNVHSKTAAAIKRSDFCKTRNVDIDDMLKFLFWRSM
jgi:hypothetical protein